MTTFNSTFNVPNLQKFKTTGIFKISFYGNSVMKLACFILARCFLPIAIVPEPSQPNKPYVLRLLKTIFIHCDWFSHYDQYESSWLKLTLSFPLLKFPLVTCTYNFF